MREVIFNRASKFDREPTADVRPSRDRHVAVMPAAAQRCPRVGECSQARGLWRNAKGYTFCWLTLCTAATVECSQVLRSFHFHFRPRAVGSGTTSVTALLKNTGSVPPALFTVNRHQVLAVLSRDRSHLRDRTG